MRPKGWRGESVRHSLAARGIRTGKLIGKVSMLDNARYYFNLYSGKLYGYVAPQKKAIKELGKLGYDFKEGQDPGGGFLIAIKGDMRIRLEPKDLEGRYVRIADFEVLRKEEIERLKKIFHHPHGGLYARGTAIEYAVEAGKSKGVKLNTRTQARIVGSGEKLIDDSIERMDSTEVVRQMATPQPVIPLRIWLNDIDLDGYTASDRHPLDTTLHARGDYRKWAVRDSRYWLETSKKRTLSPKQIRLHRQLLKTEQDIEDDELRGIRSVGTKTG